MRFFPLNSSIMEPHSSYLVFWFELAPYLHWCHLTSLYYTRIPVRYIRLVTWPVSLKLNLWGARGAHSSETRNLNPFSWLVVQLQIQGGSFYLVGHVKIVIPCKDSSGVSIAIWYYHMFLAFLAHTARKSAKRRPLRLSKRWQAQSYFVYMYTYMPREWFTRCQTFMLGICKWAWFTIALSSSYIALLPIPNPTFLHRFPGIFAAKAKKCYY